MALTNEFIEAIDDGKKTRVRIMLKDIMLVDPSLKTFDEMLEYADKNMPDLFDQHDGEEFIEDSSVWDEDYMNQQMVSVVTNFSKERIDVLGRIVQEIYAYKIQDDKSIDAISDGVSLSNNSSGLTGIQIAGCGVAAMGAIALIGGIVSSSASAAIVGGVALAGGIVMVTLGGKKEA